MKKALIFLTVIPMVAATSGAWAAVTVKKAAPVAVQSTDKMTSVATLVPTVMNIVQGVQSLSAKTKELTDECIPSSAEITWVDNMMKEWAKTGAMSAEEVKNALKREPCPGGNGYANYVKMMAGTGMTDLCYDTFSGVGNDGMIWGGYPKVGKATYCADGGNCAAKDQKNVSDIYEIFNLIDFTEADYTKQDMSMATKLVAKIENCSNAKLTAKKKEMWGEFLTTTISSVGQSTNTGSIMDAVSGVAASGGGMQSLQSLGAIATQFMGNR